MSARTKRLIRPAMAVALSLAVAACSKARSEERQPDTDPPSPPGCVTWRAEARYRPYGFDHLVHIHNACTITAECLVSTDVNPDPIPATVPPSTEVEVLTWVGSPSRTFTPSVWCQLRARARTS